MDEKFGREFKKETVKKYLDSQSVASIAREIGVNENMIHKWTKEILSVNKEIDPIISIAPIPPASISSVNCAKPSGKLAPSPHNPKRI